MKNANIFVDVDLTLVDAMSAFSDAFGRAAVRRQRDRSRPVEFAARVIALPGSWAASPSASHP